MIEKEKRFCREYVIDYNGARAAREVGYAPLSSRQTAYKLLQRIEVKQYIKLLTEERNERCNITADKILEQYRRLAFADVENYYHYEYTLREVSPFDTDKNKNKRDRILRYIGYRLTEEEFDVLPKHYKVYYECQKTIKPFELLTTEQRAAIQGLTKDKYGNPVLKLSNKESSLHALAQYTGLIGKHLEKDNDDKPTTSTKLEIKFV